MTSFRPRLCVCVHTLSSGQTVRTDCVWFLSTALCVTMSTLFCVTGVRWLPNKVVLIRFWRQYFIFDYQRSIFSVYITSSFSNNEVLRKVPCVNKYTHTPQNRETKFVQNSEIHIHYHPLLHPEPHPFTITPRLLCRTYHLPNKMPAVALIEKLVVHL